MHGCIVQRSHGGSVEEGCGVGSAWEGVNGGVLRLPAPTVSAQGARTHRTVVTGHDEVHGARDSRDCAVRQSEDREVERGDPGIPSNMGRHLPRCVRPPTPHLDWLERGSLTARFVHSRRLGRKGGDRSPGHKGPRGLQGHYFGFPYRQAHGCGQHQELRSDR